MPVYKGSRYIQTPLYPRGEVLTFGIRTRHHFNLSNAVYHTFVEGETLDSIAHRYYNNSQLWWAIMDANPRYQSEIEIKSGDVLCIPPFEEVVKVSE